MKLSALGHMTRTGQLKNKPRCHCPRITWNKDALLPGSSWPAVALSRELCSKLEARSSPISNWGPEVMSALTTLHSQALIAMPKAAGEV